MLLSTISANYIWRNNINLTKNLQSDRLEIKFSYTKLLAPRDQRKAYLSNPKSCLNDIICMRVLKQLLEVSGREQFMDDLWPCFIVTYHKTLFNYMATKLLPGQIHIVTLKLTCQLGCCRWDLKFQNELNDIISAHKVNGMRKYHFAWERLQRLKTTRINYGFK